MAILTTDEAKTLLDLTTDSEDDKLDLLVAAACAAVERYCGRKFEEDDYVEYLDGLGYRDIVLKHRPVIEVEHVYVDQNGYYGDGIGAFPDSSELTLGVHYAIKKDGDGEGTAGLLRKIGPAGGQSVRRGWLTEVGRVNTWPVGDGNIKVEYTAGYEEAPADVKQAAFQMLAWMRSAGPNGGVGKVSEHLAEYGYDLGPLTDMAASTLAAVGEMGSTRQLLSKWREVAL